MIRPVATIAVAALVSTILGCGSDDAASDSPTGKPDAGAADADAAKDGEPPDGPLPDAPVEGGPPPDGAPDAEPEASVPTECNDGIDNDGDGLVDWQFDLGCYGSADTTEGTIHDALDHGWTVFEPASDTRIFYVSSSTGDDAWSGLAPEWDGTDGPKKTASAAIALLSDPSPDWLLFKRGDVWVGETMGNWKISGRSAEAPVIVATYGESVERPRFEVSDTWLITHGGGGASEHRSHVRILGIHVAMVSKDPFDPRFNGQGGSCIQWLRDGGDVLIEDMKCSYAQLNLQSEPTLPFRVRRNVLTKNYSLDSHAQCMFTSIGAELLIEENVFDHGGWSDDFRLALWNPETDPTVWAAISDGRFAIELEGNAYQIDGVDLSAASSMQDVASALESAINAEAGAGSVTLLFTAGGAFQLRSGTFASDAGYGVAAYAGTTPGTDLHDLLNASAQGSPESTIFNRNMYLAYGKGNTTVRGNIDANGASGGVQQRMGGVNEDNLFLRNPHAVIFGSNQNLADEYVGGVIRNNVVLGSRDIDTQVQGSGILAHSYVMTDKGGHSRIRDLEITGNIIAHNQLGTGNFKGITLAGDAPFDNVSVHHNIVYDWARPVWPNPMDQRSYCMRLNAVDGSTNTEVHNNLLQQPLGGFLVSADNNAHGISLHDNTYWSTAPDPPDIWSRGWFDLGGSASMAEWVAATGEVNASAEQVAFVDPDRTIESYMLSLGGEGTYEAFMEQARLQSKHAWRDAYTAAAVNAYVRAGFEVVP